MKKYCITATFFTEIESDKDMDSLLDEYKGIIEKALPIFNLSCINIKEMINYEAKMY